MGPTDATPRLVVFTLDGQRYALPASAVERVLAMAALSPLPQAPAIALGVINVHGRVLPVLDIRRRFGLPDRAYGLTAQLLVARTQRRTVVLPVDAVLEVTEVAPQAIIAPDTILPGIGHLAGIVALPGGLLFIHDLDGFLSLDEEQELTQALRGLDE